MSEVWCRQGTSTLCQEQIKSPARLIACSNPAFVSQAVWALPLQQRDQLLPGERALSFVATEESGGKVLPFG